MSKDFSFKVVDLLENEDGSVTMTIDADAEHFAFVYQIGMKFILYCAIKNKSVEQILEAILKEVEGE